MWNESFGVKLLVSLRKDGLAECWISAALMFDMIYLRHDDHDDESPLFWIDLEYAPKFCYLFKIPRPSQNHFTLQNNTVGASSFYWALVNTESPKRKHHHKQ